MGHRRKNTGRPTGRPKSAKKQRPARLPGFAGKGTLTPEGVGYLRAELQHYSRGDTASLLGVSVKTVCLHARATLGSTNTPRTPPTIPHSPEAESRRAVVQKILDNDEDALAPDVVRKLFVDYEIDVHLSTVKRDIAALNLVFRHSASCPNWNTPIRIERRLSFCLRDDVRALAAANNLVFSDEKIFRAECVRLGQYVRRGERAAPNPRERYTCALHVMGFIAIGKRRLYLLPPANSGSGPRGGATSQDIISTLSPDLPALKKMCEGKLLVLDGCRVHTSATMVAWLEKNGIRVLDGWPSYSPDLNPIENYWSMLNREVNWKSEPLGPDARGIFWQCLKEVAANIEIVKVDRLCTSFLGRLEDCAAAGGAWIGK